MPTKAQSRFKRLIVVSYRLPFKTVIDNGQEIIIQNSGGLVSAISALSEKKGGEGPAEIYQKIVWIGKGDDLVAPKEVPPSRRPVWRLVEKFFSGKMSSPNTKPSSELLLDGSSKYQLVPVEIPAAINDKYYGGFCNDLIWPLFHHFPSMAVHNESYFENYVTANKLFADKILSVMQPDDFIWIHDYQLFLVPELIRNKYPNANVSFFLHIPFPGFEDFRTMPRHWRNSILQGVLGSDLIGFHTYDYSQYFLRTVSRLLGHEITMNSVSVGDRIVKVDAYPIGIDYEKFNGAAINSKPVDIERKKILGTLKNLKLIFSIDRLDYSKGLLHRLEAFECFLETYPEWLGKIVFNMIVIPSRDSILQYQNMKREIESAVGRINGKFSTMAWRPIIYQYKSIPFAELVALYDLSLVGLITPLRDGMNLVAKEYVACQVTQKGVLILSEMAGAAAELSETILINPADKHEVADAINKALIMPERSRTILIARMQKRIKTYTVFTWAKDIIDNMELIKKEQEVRKVNVISPLIESEIIALYQNALRRVIFLDYDGTLVPFSKVPELAVPGAKTITQLKMLSENPKNTVVIISGRDKNFLNEWFADNNIYLIAEHGAFLKSPHMDWECTLDSDQSWKVAFLAVLQRYTDRCNGSFIEEKFSSLAWHYRNAPQEIGQIKAKELKEEVRAMVSHENKLQVLEGSMVLEVKRSGFDKGMAASKFVANVKSDFIMAMGDDKTDEDIFRSLPPESITIKIGITSSLAKYNLANQNEVSRIIDRFIECK